uniref:Uncharacterized protein n=1 Tax=Anopheles maculatus TaxID=74869 RepID=A0A182SH43_9DIPT
MVKTAGVDKNTGKSVRSTMSHVFDTGPFVYQDALQARSIKSAFHAGPQHFYQPNSLAYDSTLLCDELKLLLFMQQHQLHQQQLQTPASISRSSQSAQQPTNRNRTSMITRPQFASGSAVSVTNTNATTAAAVDRSICHSHPKHHFLSVHNRLPRAFNSNGHWLDHVERLHLDEQQCMLASMQAQLLYNWYLIWEATDQHSDHWWKNRTDVRNAIQTATICPLQNALLQAFYQLLSSAGDGGYFHPFIHFDLRHREKPPVLHRRYQNSRRGQYRAGQLPLAKAVSHSTPAGTSLPKPINTTNGRRPSIGNNNPLTPFLFVYVPLLTPLPAPQQLAFAVNHNAGSPGPPVSPRRSAPPSPSGLPPSTSSLDAIINDRLVQPFVYAPFSNDN